MEKWIIKFLRRLKEGHQQSFDFKNLKLLNNSVRAIFLKREVY